MGFLNLNYNLITEESIQFLGQNTKITYLNPGSKARAILDSVNDKLFQQSVQLEENTGRAFLRFASGQLLDYIGEVFGVERLLSEKAEVYSEENNFYFYTSQTNFGAINGGNDIIIDAGTATIYDRLNYNEAKAIYKNKDKIILPAGEKKVFFSAAAVGYGSDYNSGTNSLNFHNFTSYSDAVNGSLFVSNQSAITYGRDDESDDNFRYRIKQQTLSSEAANDTAIRSALLTVAGISEVIKIKYPRGIGTADWIIKAVTSEVSQSLIDSAQNAINEVQAEGSENLAVAPYIIGLTMSFYLTYVSGVSDKDKINIKQMIRTSLTRYVNSLSIGQKLTLDQLVKIILSSSKLIESLGKTGDKSDFERLSIIKRSSVDNSLIRRTLTNDYIAKFNERVIIEPNVSEPIIIKDNN